MDLEVPNVAFQLFRKVLGASYEHSRYYVKFRLKSVHSEFYNTFHIADLILVIYISGKLAPSTFQVKEFV